LTIKQINLKNDTAIRKEIIMCRYIIISIVFLIPLQLIAAEKPSVSQLLDKYAETQDKFNLSFSKGMGSFILPVS